MEKLGSIINNRPNPFKSQLRIVGKSEEQPPAPAAPSTITAVPGACPKCRGTGWLRANVPFGHPQFGKPQPCACKLAERKERVQHKLAASGITASPRFADASFASFSCQVPGVGYAYRAARQFAAAPLGWLVLLGPCGCGKTHLAVAIAKERIAAGETVLFQIVPKLLDDLRSAFSPLSEQTYDERLQEMQDVDLLVLDDYGAHKGTPWANEKLFQLLNSRYNANLPTVISSNNGLAGIDERIASRLSDRELVTTIDMRDARDYRIYRDDQEEE